MDFHKRARSALDLIDEALLEVPFGKYERVIPEGMYDGAVNRETEIENDLPKRFVVTVDGVKMYLYKYTEIVVDGIPSSKRVYDNLMVTYKDVLELGPAEETTWLSAYPKNDMRQRQKYHDTSGQYYQVQYHDEKGNFVCQMNEPIGMSHKAADYKDWKANYINPLDGPTVVAKPGTWEDCHTNPANWGDFFNLQDTPF